MAWLLNTFKSLSSSFNAKKGDLWSFFVFIFIYGLIINYSVSIGTQFDFPFAIYTFLGWGCAFYLFKKELVEDILFKAIILWRRGR